MIFYRLPSPKLECFEVSLLCMNSFLETAQQDSTVVALQKWLKEQCQANSQWLCKNFSCEGEITGNIKTTVKTFWLSSIKRRLLGAIAFSNYCKGKHPWPREANNGDGSNHWVPLPSLVAASNEQLPRGTGHPGKPSWSTECDWVCCLLDILEQYLKGTLIVACPKAKS